MRPKWQKLTSKQAERILHCADEEGVRVCWQIPPADSGQIVEVAYAGLGADGIIERTYDRADRSTSYRIRDWIDGDEDMPGLNYRPA